PSRRRYVTVHVAHSPTMDPLALNGTYGCEEEEEEGSRPCVAPGATGLRRGWLVGAGRVGCQRVAGHRPRPGAAAAAEGLEVAASALALEALGVAQRTEQLGVAVPVRERRLPHRAGGELQEPRR